MANDDVTPGTTPSDGDRSYEAATSDGGTHSINMSSESDGQPSGPKRPRKTDAGPKRPSRSTKPSSGQSPEVTDASTEPRDFEGSNPPSTPTPSLSASGHTAISDGNETPNSLTEPSPAADNNGGERQGDLEEVEAERGVDVEQEKQVGEPGGQEQASDPEGAGEPLTSEGQGAPNEESSHASPDTESASGTPHDAPGTSAPTGMPATTDTPSLNPSKAGGAAKAADAAQAATKTGAEAGKTAAAEAGKKVGKDTATAAATTGAGQAAGKAASSAAPGLGAAKDVASAAKDYSQGNLTDGTSKLTEAGAEAAADAVAPGSGALVNAALNTKLGKKANKLVSKGIVWSVISVTLVLVMIAIIATVGIMAILNSQNAVVIAASVCAAPVSDTPGGEIPSQGNESNAEYVWGVLLGEGLTEQAAAGVLGNLQQESGIDPNAIQNNGAGPGTGIAQWEDGSASGRWVLLTKWADKKGLDKWKLETQVGFMLKEMYEGWGSFSMKKYAKISDPVEAARYFGKYYEAFGEEGPRNQYAVEWYNKLKGTEGKTTVAAVNALATTSGGSSSRSLATDAVSGPVFVLGDSLTVGAKPYILKAYKKADVDVTINATTGISTSAAAKKLDSAAAKKANVWVIALGTNDFSESAFQSAASDIVRKADGKPVFWINIYRPNKQKPINDAIDKLAAKNSNVTVIDYASEAEKHKSDFAQDPQKIHPSDYSWRADLYETPLTGVAPVLDLPKVAKNGKNSFAYMPLNGVGGIQTEGSITDSKAWSTSKVLVIFAYLDKVAKGDPTKLSDEARKNIKLALSESDMDALLWLRGRIPGGSGAPATKILRSVGDKQTGPVPNSNEGSMEWTVQNQVKFMAAMNNGKVVSKAASSFVMNNMVPVASQSWGLGKVGATAFKGGWLTAASNTRQMGILDGHAVALITNEGPVEEQIDGDSAHVEAINDLADILQQYVSGATDSADDGYADCTCPTGGDGMVVAGDWSPPMKKMDNNGWDWGENPHNGHVHGGEDYVGATGTPLFAMTNARVVSVGSSYGTTVLQTQVPGGTLNINYMHQSQQFVKEGDEVIAGQKIGLVGGMGDGNPNKYGAHLHLEMWWGEDVQGQSPSPPTGPGQSTQTQNPNEVMRAIGVKVANDDHLGGLGGATYNPKPDYSPGAISELQSKLGVGGGGFVESTLTTAIGEMTSANCSGAPTGDIGEVSCPTPSEAQKNKFGGGFPYSGMSPDAQYLLDCVWGTFGDAFNPSTYNGHSPTWAQAIDFMLPKDCSNVGRPHTNSPEDYENGNKLVLFLNTHWKELGVDYFIWQDHIRNPGEHSDENKPAKSYKDWRQDDYNNGDCNNTHYNHVHVSVIGDQATGIK